MGGEKRWLRDLQDLLDRLFGKDPYGFAQACAAIDDRTAFRSALDTSPAIPGNQWRLGPESVTIRRPGTADGPSVVSMSTENGTVNRVTYENGTLSRIESATLGQDALKVVYFRNGEALPLCEHALPTTLGAVDFAALLRETTDPLTAPQGQRVPPGVEPEIRHATDRHGARVPVVFVDGRECPWERLAPYPDRIEAHVADARQQFADLEAAADAAARAAQAAGRVADYKKLDDLRSEASRTVVALLRLEDAGVERVALDTGGAQEPLAYAAARAGVEELASRTRLGPAPR